MLNADPMLLVQGGAAPIVRIGRPVLPAQAQMQLELCRQLQDGHSPLVGRQRISWLQVIIDPSHRLMTMTDIAPPLW